MLILRIKIRWLAKKAKGTVESNPTKYKIFTVCSNNIAETSCLFLWIFIEQMFLKKNAVSDVRVTCPNIIKQKLELFANFVALLPRMIQDNKTLVMKSNCNINQITLKYSTEVHPCIGKHISTETVHAITIYVICYIFGSVKIVKLD